MLSLPRTNFYPCWPILPDTYLELAWGTIANLDRFPSLCLYRFAVESAPRGCTEDEGWPLEAGLQEQASNHLKLLWPKARVVSVKEKSRLRL